MNVFGWVLVVIALLVAIGLWKLADVIEAEDVEPPHLPGLEPPHKHWWEP